MQKIKFRKQSTQKLLAALVMGMNFVNTVTPAAAAMQNMPESMEALPALPKNEAEPLEYTALPQALQCVESVIFGKAEAKDYAAGNVDRLEHGDKMTVSMGQVGSANINNGGLQAISSGGTGFIINNTGYEGKNGILLYGDQNISSGGTGFINTVMKGGQNIWEGGFGSAGTVERGGGQGVSGGTGIIDVMKSGAGQAVYNGGTGSVNTMHGGQIVVSVGTGIVNNMNYGAQYIESGVGSIINMNDGEQNISSGGTGIISAMKGGGQRLYGGTGIISSMEKGGQSIESGGTGIISVMKGGWQTIYEGTALNTTIFNGKIILSEEKSQLTNATVHGGDIRFGSSLKGGENYKFSGDFTFDGGTIDMTKDWMDRNIVSYKNLTIENFKKGGGDIVMLTDLESEKDGDKLIINKADAGTSYIKVVDKSLNGTKPVSKNKKLLLVTVKDGKAAFAGKELNTGGLWSVTPTIERGDKVKDSNGKVIGTDKEWYLSNFVRSLNNDTKVLLDSVDSSYALWRNTNDSLRKRLGELRLRSKAADGDGIWARYNGGKFASDSFSGSYNMYQLGYDKADNEKSIYGFALEKGSGKGSYSFGSSKDKLFAGSFYGVWTGEDGSYTDVTAKIGQFSSDVKSHGDYPDKADYKNRAYSLSVEYGKTIELSKGAGTFIEPQAQFIAGHMASTKYTTDRGNNVYLGAVNSYIGRLGFVLGQKAEDGNEVYLKASALREFGGGRDVSMLSAGDKLDMSKDYKDTWFELGLGTNIKLSKAGYFYGDIERSFGAEIKKKWQINAGLRWSF